MTTGEACSGNRLTVVGTCGKVILEGTHMTVRTYDMDSREYGKTAQVTSGQQLNMTVTELDFPRKTGQSRICSVILPRRSCMEHR